MRTRGRKTTTERGPPQQQQQQQIRKYAKKISQATLPGANDSRNTVPEQGDGGGRFPIGVSPRECRGNLDAGGGERAEGCVVLYRVRRDWAVRWVGECGHTLVQFSPQGLKEHPVLRNKSLSACYDLGLRHLRGCSPPVIRALCQKRRKQEKENCSGTNRRGTVVTIVTVLGAD